MRKKKWFQWIFQALHSLNEIQQQPRLNSHHLTQNNPKWDSFSRCCQREESCFGMLN